MDTDRVAEAIQHLILDRSERVERRWDSPAAVILQTRRYHYRAEPASWSIASEPWVEAAVRVVAEGDRTDMVPIFGLLFPRTDSDAASDSGGAGSSVVYLNDVAAMAALGRRLEAGLDPLAYAELLAELHFPSGAGAQQPISRPTVTGALIRDASTFLAGHPFVDPTLIATGPAVHHSGHGITLTFQSYIRFLRVDFGSALTIFDWTVSAPGGKPATWAVTPVAERLEVTG